MLGTLGSGPLWGFYCWGCVGCFSYCDVLWRGDWVLLILFFGGGYGSYSSADYRLSPRDSS